MPIIDFNRPLVLATASEARRKLVYDTGLRFTAFSVDVDETPLDGEQVAPYVERLAKTKAEAANPTSLDAVIVAVDTAIGLDGNIIGKPEDEAHARQILRLLSGRTHEVVSAIALSDIKNATIDTTVTITEVEFVDLSDQAIEWYIKTKEWKNRAGAYAIQGKGAALVLSVRGCFTNVIGISISTLLEMLKKASSNNTLPFVRL
ncbi:MAG: Maf family protein, partial [Pseudomonadota bacterium]